MLLRPGDIGALQAQGIAALRELEAGLCRAEVFAACVSSPPTGRQLPTSPAFPMWRWRPMAASRWMLILRSGSGRARSAALDKFIEMPGIHRLHELKPEPQIEPGEA